MVRDILLAIHITAGVSGLVLGPTAMLAPKRRGPHIRAGLAYQAAVATMALSALGLVAQNPGHLWGFAVIAVLTEVAALAGWAVQRRRGNGWLPQHVGLMAGSYVSLVTAALVVNWPSPLAWILPTIVGTPLIAAAATRAGRASTQPSVAAARNHNG